MTRSASARSDEALSVYADRAAAFVGLEIPADCRAGVLANLKTLREHATLVMSFPLDPEVEATPVFRP
jgi:hypothetical protein